jgi:hypothetical protein
VVSRSTEARGAAEDVFHEMRRGVSAAEGGAEMRFLWFTAGFLEMVGTFVPEEGV